jgi:hypothetical protein
MDDGAPPGGLVEVRESSSNGVSRWLRPRSLVAPTAPGAPATRLRRWTACDAGGYHCWWLTDTLSRPWCPSATSSTLVTLGGVTFLEQLIDDASGDQVPVSTLLRKVKVVAKRLGNVNLEAWVDHELTGYPEGADLPDYRASRPAEVLGDFAGPFQSGMKNAPIPAALFPDEFRDGFLFAHTFTEPISKIEAFAASKTTLTASWPADAVALTNRWIKDGLVDLYGGMGLLAAWKPMAAAEFGVVVDTVRTRILDLALSLEDVAPDAGEPDADADPATIEPFVVNVYGGNVAVNSSDFTQNITMPAVGDINALFAVLDTVGVSQEEQEALREAIVLDEQAGEGSPQKSIGSRVRSWAGDVALKASSSAGKGAAGAAGGLALKALASYYGVDFT